MDQILLVKQHKKMLKTLSTLFLELKMFSHLYSRQKCIDRQSGLFSDSHHFREQICINLGRNVLNSA